MWRNNPSLASIIGRREIEPLFHKASETLKSYEEATGTVTAILDQSGRSARNDARAALHKFCSLCKKHGHDPLPENDACPCMEVRSTALEEAKRTGSCIHTCGLGLAFWTAPLFANGYSPGVLVAGGVLGTSRSTAAEKLHSLFPDDPGLPEAETMLSEIKEKTGTELRDLARLLIISAEQISRFPGDYRSPDRKHDGGGTTQLRLVRKEEGGAWPMELERTLLAALRRGDGDAWRKALNGLLDHVQSSAKINFEPTRHRVMELAVLLSREAMSPDKNRGEPYGEIPAAPRPVNTRKDRPPEESDGAILEHNNRCLKRIEEARDGKELAGVLRLIAERLSSSIFSFKGVRHASALRKAERYIWENYTRKISLNEIARASGLSGPYFSSIFKEEMGEKLSNYLNRLRVERAMTMLAEPENSLNDIAIACGFEDQSWFSKIFKYFTGITPGKFREQGQHRFPAAAAKIGNTTTIGPWVSTALAADYQGAFNSKETG